MEDEVKTPEQIIKELNDKLAEYKKMVESKADSKAIDDLKSEIETLKKAHEDARYKALEDIIEKQGTEIAKMKDRSPEQTPRSFKTVEEAISWAILSKGEDGSPSVKEQIDALVKAPTKQREPISFKVAVTMGEGNTIGSGSTQVLLTEFTGIYSQIRKRELRYLANVSVGRIGTERALWVEEQDEQGTPIFIGEGDAKTQLSSIWVEKNKSVKKIAVFGKVTTELIADLPQLISYIQNNMMRRLDIAVEDALFSGDDIGDNLAGLEQFATAFSAGALASSVVNANELDVLEAVALQVEVAHGISNAVFIHPSTLAKIKLVKDSTGRPIWKDYVTTNGMMEVSGQRIISTTAVTAGEFIGGDLSVVNVLIREELGIQIGLDGNDFTQNKKTMLTEKRLVQFVSANDEPVLVMGDFETAKAALITV